MTIMHISGLFLSSIADCCAGSERCTILPVRCPVAVVSSAERNITMGINSWMFTEQCRSQHVSTHQSPGHGSGLLFELTSSHRLSALLHNGTFIPRGR